MDQDAEPQAKFLARFHGDGALLAATFNELRGIDAQLFSRSVDILVSRLRQKLQDTSRQPRFIKTVWGTGYAFVGEEVQPS